MSQLHAFSFLLASLILASSASSQSMKVDFSTYLGGSAMENLRDITTDVDGNIYVTGGTGSPNFPTTEGAYDRIFATGGGSLGTGGPMDVFVTKLDRNGQVIWSTFFGGPNYDRAYAIEVDREGFVYVGGRAGDSLPTTLGVVQTRFGGDQTPNGAYGKQDGFIAKLSPDGATLLWATYFGATDYGFFRDIDIDAEGNVYGIYTGAKHISAHITPGAYDTSMNGGDDMIVVKVSPDARQVIYASYLGGSGNDGSGPSIRVNGAGEAFVASATNSSDFPTTPGAADLSYNGGKFDLAVTRLNASGSALIYSTYFGGSGNEALETHNLAIDEQNNAYVHGYTTSTDLPVTNNAYQRTFGGAGDVPIAKISPDGTQFLAVSYFGGTGEEGSQGIAVDGNGDIVFGGGANGIDFPATSDALQSIGKGLGEFFIVKMNNDLSSVIYSTLVGGSNADDGRTAWADTSDRIFVAGHSRSDDFPLVSPWQSTRAGADDGVIVVLSKAVAAEVERAENFGSGLLRNVHAVHSVSGSSIAFSLEDGAAVQLELVDICGRSIDAASRSWFGSKGDHSFSLHGNGLTSGVYFYRLSAASNVSSETQQGSLLIR